MQGSNPFKIPPIKETVPHSPYFSSFLIPHQGGQGIGGNMTWSRRQWQKQRRKRPAKGSIVIRLGCHASFILCDLGDVGARREIWGCVGHEEVQRKSGRGPGERERSKEHHDYDVPAVLECHCPAWLSTRGRTPHSCLPGEVATCLPLIVSSPHPPHQKSQAHEAAT